MVGLMCETGWGDATATLGVHEALALAAGGVRSAAPGLVWVQGEVEGLTRSRAGHWYWTLAGDGSRLAVCALGRDASAIDQTLSAAQVSLANGLTLRVRGSLGVYPQRGQVQLRAAAVDPAVSVGGAVLARRNVRARLDAAGLPGRQGLLRPPRCPLRVGVVAPPGKGLEDFLEVLGRSPWAWTVRVVKVASEGPDAPASIAAAIARLRRADLVVVTRGGGSGAVTAYDSFEVCQAVCSSPAPVVVAVGHSSDASLADECAFAAAATPTAAGELCVGLLERADAAVGDVVGDIVARSRVCLDRARRDLVDAETAVSSCAARLSDRAARAARAAAERSRRNCRLALAAVVVLAVAVIVMLVSR